MAKKRYRRIRPRSNASAAVARRVREAQSASFISQVLAPGDPSRMKRALAAYREREDSVVRRVPIGYRTSLTV
ncbi:hypothetical protein EMQ25_15100 [Arsenicitalea aurantiaca]|uniref:Uncharacterized protein n=1 Tax=Arsenicitalea aurantiaca TaxID=1783274 RepID=A0A433X5V7_9HYPH|nr:hypothetical protein [Arsenicitalea aurantiaca]RUT29439.1 hypothetical protein EMQ25_15100 [Arsenicitalea aurantiaca]